MSKKIAHGYHLVEGKAFHRMEDYVVAEFKQVGDNELGLFAIFDGHLGHIVPDYLKSHLFDNILNEASPSTFTGDVARVDDGQLAVARAFGDKSLKEHLSSEPDVMTNREAVDATGDIKDARSAAKRLTEEAVIC
ncbi:hypothetical protein V6N13_087931 [Hibiscus sabdariffa]